MEPQSVLSQLRARKHPTTVLSLQSQGCQISKLCWHMQGKGIELRLAVCKASVLYTMVWLWLLFEILDITMTV